MSTWSSARTPTRRELLAYQELGLCEPGEQAKLLASGATELGGTLPVNTSGGLLSKGEPLGASALGQVIELVHQLRGEAGARQVAGARRARAHRRARRQRVLRHRQALSQAQIRRLGWSNTFARAVESRRS